MTPIQWPPPTGLSYHCINESFKWDGTEPFYETDSQGQVSGGWVHKILRYAKANNHEVTLDMIYEALAAQLPVVLRSMYFRESPNAPGVDLSVPSPRLSKAVLPASLVKAARIALPNQKWGVAADEAVVGEFTDQQWLRTLRDWKIRFSRMGDLPSVAGPVWWYAIHTLALNCAGLQSDCGTWVNYWHGEFPCKTCRQHFTKCPVTKPRSWADLEAYAGAAHDWVSANK